MTSAASVRRTRNQALAEEPDFLNELFLLQVAGAISGRLRQLGLTQADLAGRLGVTESAVSQLLGVSRPDAKLSTIQRAALAVGLKVTPVIVAVDGSEPLESVAVRRNRR